MPDRKPSTFWTKAWLSLSALAAITALGALFYGRLAPPPEAKAPPPPAAKAEPTSVEVFDAAWEMINRNFYDKTFGGTDWAAAKERYRPIAEKADNTAVLYQEAIRPLLAELSASHVYVDLPKGANAPPGYKANARNHRGDVIADNSSGLGYLGGLHIAWDGERWTVVDVEKGSEAEKLGIGPGRELIGSSVTALTQDEPKRIHADLRFKAGGGEETVAYDYVYKPRWPDTASKKLPSGVTLVRFEFFDDACVDFVLAKLKEAGPEGVILDIRTNPGGNVGQTRRLLGALLPYGTPMGKSVGRMLTLPLSTLSQPTFVGPLAVLIGPRSKSAAEIFPEVLREHRRAFLVGDRTAGAVLTARNFGLPDGGRLTIATGDYILPNGDRLEGVGVSPDIKAAETLEAIRGDRDLVVEAAEKAVLDWSRKMQAQ